MNRKVKIFAGAVAMALAIGVVTSAQAPVTVTMRSGEVVQGSLIDMGARGFELNVNGSQRMIAKDQVAMVDFGGTVTTQAAWFNGLSMSNNLVVLKSGATMNGDWTDVGGTSPLVLRFNTGSGEREVNANDVARIYLVAPASTSPVMPTTPMEGAVVVQANQPWTSAGITVKTGEYLRFGVTGEIQFGTGATDRSTSDGNAAASVSAVFRSVPVRGLPVGALIGKVGNGAPFSIGSAPEPIRMPSNGQLFLGVNDLTFNDNAGAFQVVIARGR